jgi:hypothetical protein
MTSGRMLRRAWSSAHDRMNLRMTDSSAPHDVPNSPPVAPSGRCCAVAVGPQPGPELDRSTVRSRVSELAGWYRRLAGLSWPKRYPLIQFPNAPLIIAFLAGLAAGRLHGMAHDDARAISYLSMIVWAYLELAHGVNRFRNLLGLVYVISTTVHLASALHR